MGMWPIARVNKPESDNPSSLESVELATDSSGPSEEPIRRSIVHFAWERGHLRRNPAMSLVMTLGVSCLPCFALMRRWGKKAIWVTIMKSGTTAFIKPSNAPIPKARAAILPIVVPPQEDRSMATTR